MPKNIYQKEFTRDFSVIMEEVWFYALTSGIEKYLNFKKSSVVPLVFYSRNGAIEVWSDEKFINSFLKKTDRLVKKFPDIFTKILDDYEQQLAVFILMFKSKHLKNREELDKLIKLIFKITSTFTREV